MQIPVQILEKWKTLRSEADTEKIWSICNESGHPTTTATIRTAFREGKCSDELFKIIAKYYEEKLKMVSEFMPPLKSAKETA